MNLLEDIIGRLGALPAKERAEVEAMALKATAKMIWVPNAGPQTAAYFSDADELFYGGQAGGGKTDLVVGLALTAHRRSLVLRRLNKEAKKLIERFAEVIGHRNGLNGQDGVWRLPEGRIIDIGGCQLEDDKQGYKGNPHDLIAFDEVSDFSESQYTFIIGWNRSADLSQRCRVLATGNPPTRPEGLWVIRRWAAWLDPQHPNPARPGELRWYTTGDDGREIEVEGRGPHLIGGQMINAKSRTFVRARLADNPDLAQTDYDATLAALPEQLRTAYREGRFDASLRDDPWQTIPTAWVRAAQARWTPQIPKGVPMCAMGVDVAQGGDDETVLAIRHDGWFAPLVAVPGRQTPYGRDIAGLIISYRRDAATVIIDCGGGYGGAAFEHLKSNDTGFPVIAYKGATKSTRRTRDRKLTFVNKRSETIWRFREALDPSQPGGSPIMLPEDPALVADLTAPTFVVGPNGVKVESKEDVCDRLGRSTDRGDAVVMAWSDGLKIENLNPAMANGDPGGEQGGVAWERHRTPQVILGREAARGTMRRR